MNKSIGLIGQSNMQQMWSLPVGASPCPPNTPANYMWQNGWVAPVNSLAVLCNSLAYYAQKEVRVLPCAIGGTFMGDWVDTGPNGALGKFLAALDASGTDLIACAFVHGETDAHYGNTPQLYKTQLIAMHNIICAHVGKTPAQLPLYVSPLGMAEKIEPYGRQIFEGQITAMLTDPTILRGPEYYNLPTVSGDVHLNEAGVGQFAVAWSQILTPVVKAN